MLHNSSVMKDEGVEHEKKLAKANILNRQCRCSSGFHLGFYFRNSPHTNRRNPSRIIDKLPADGVESILLIKLFDLIRFLANLRSIAWSSLLTCSGWILRQMSSIIELSSMGPEIRLNRQTFQSLLQKFLPARSFLRKTEYPDPWGRCS